MDMAIDLDICKVRAVTFAHNIARESYRAYNTEIYASRSGSMGQHGALTRSTQPIHPVRGPGGGGGSIHFEVSLSARHMDFKDFLYQETLCRLLHCSLSSARPSIEQLCNISNCLHHAVAHMLV
ncbi:hypothetical protein AWZ03_003088 [Drosophila navojoa]|uniref:Uncharacterized protein n=1 Tax=Drosophila navojoa TaxID=7232 RepID=A0A484BNV1_DRONA|nr:hypothetical protein AWZ03_003088 [Drosophila navojoa]